MTPSDVAVEPSSRPSMSQNAMRSSPVEVGTNTGWVLRSLPPLYLSIANLLYVKCAFTCALRKKLGVEQYCNGYILLPHTLFGWILHVVLFC